MSSEHDPFEGLAIKDDHLLRVLQGRDFLVQDGGMGTMLQERGLVSDGSLPDLLNLENPEAVTAIHRAYVEAGAEMVTTNTFGANARKLAGRAAVVDVYRAAVACARASGARYVAGDIGPAGALLEPWGELSFEDAYALFAEQARAAEAAGCDLVAIETMSDVREAKAAVLAAKENCALPVFATMTFGEDGRTFLGTPPEVAGVVLSSLGAHAVGVNCSLGPDELVPVVERIARAARCPVIARPNAGLPRVEGGRTVYDVDPDGFARAMGRIVACGASVLGGCCGTTPAHVARLAALVAGRVPDARAWRPAFVVTGAQEACVLREGERGFAVVGERINPTGKKRLKQALREGDYDYLVGEAAAQKEAGANLLDVNVGLPDVDEPRALREAVEALQEACTLPLQIDSSDPAAIEAAARVYAGKPLVNSVNGKRESLRDVLPVVKRYGCAVVGLTLDEDGIPPTAEGRFAIAQRIVEAAEAHGIPRCDVAIDCLVMAAATNQDEVMETLRAVRMVKERLGVRTVLGVSNVSFGLPRRDVVNAAFLAAALGAGLDLPILNPLSGRCCDVLAAFRVLNGQDAGAADYVEAYAGTEGLPAADGPARGGASCGADAGTAGGGIGRGAAEVGGGAVGGGADAGVGGGAAGVAVAREGAGAPVSAVGASGGVPCGAGARAHAAAAQVEVPEALADAAGDVRQAVGFVLAGRAAPMPKAVRALLAGHDALDVVNGVLVAALDVVGAKYESGEFFLPQLMASAEAAKAGFDAVSAWRQDGAAAAQGGFAGEPGEGTCAVQDGPAGEPGAEAAGAAQGGTVAAQDGPAAARTILLATVEGDVHDIGKNIVRMLLENYGFPVIDLGRDVSPEDIADAALRHGVRLVGLSALMTTTVKAMERTIALLHDRAPHVAVMVGGAVLTPDYAQQIGADFYAKDAAEAARVAARFFQEAESPAR